MRALVTGASGFIGSHLVRYLVKKGLNVRALVRSRGPFLGLQGLEVEFYEGDLRQPLSLERALKGCDLLFHAAAHYDFWAQNRNVFYEVNVCGTENILQAARKAGVSKIVYTSTVGTIRCPKNPDIPSDENCRAEETEMDNDYKRSKFLAERIARRHAREGLPVVIVNPSAPIGAFDVKPTPTGRVVLDFLRGKIPAYVDTGLNIIDVADVAEGHWLAVQKGKIGERYILGHQNISLREIFQLLSRINGGPDPKRRIPYRAAWMAALISEAASRLLKRRPKISLGAVRMARQYMYFDSSRARLELGLSQSPVEEAFAKAADWFAANGYLQKT